MTKALTTTENSKKESDNNNATKNVDCTIIADRRLIY